jgi:hypothetical protein
MDFVVVVRKIIITTIIHALLGTFYARFRPCGAPVKIGMFPLTLALNRCYVQQERRCRNSF